MKTKDQKSGGGLGTSLYLPRIRHVWQATNPNMICHTLSRVWFVLCYTGSNPSLLKVGVQALLNDGTFKIASQPAASARKIAEMLSTWIPQNEEKALKFEEGLVKLLSPSIQPQVKSLKAQREKMWTAYHALRTSKNYRALWESLFKQLGMTVSPIFCQYVGHHIFKLLIAEHFTLNPTTSTDLPKPLTLEETFGLRYAAGYIPRSLRKKITKSKHPLKSDLLLCLFDLLDEGDDADHDSKRWVEFINRGGLTRVNNSTCICTSWSDFISTVSTRWNVIFALHIPTNKHSLAPKHKSLLCTYSKYK